MSDHVTPRKSRPARTSLRPREPEIGGTGAPEPEDAGNSQIGFPPIAKTDLPADIVLARLAFLKCRINGKNPWQVSCPAHADFTPSLSLTELDTGVLLLNCFAGCSIDQILEKLNLNERHLFPSRFALHFSERKPTGAKSVAGGRKREGEIVEVTDEQCDHWRRLLTRWSPPQYALRHLSTRLGLPIKSLVAFDIGFDEDRDCWVFPERDGEGRIVGLMQRFYDKRKIAIQGSVRGLTLSKYDGKSRDSPLYLAEGASDTIALHSVGATAIGRSGAKITASQRHWLFERIAAKYPDRKIIVVADRNETGVGSQGAMELREYLQNALGCAVSWAMPARGYKDVREQIVDGQWTKGLILQRSNL